MMESAEWKLVLHSCLKALNRKGAVHPDLAKISTYYHRIINILSWKGLTRIIESNS